jgi:hypothetical protein
MIIGDQKRIYFAGVLAKITEFVVSILIIGYLISTKIDPKIKLDLWYLIFSGLIAIILMLVGILVTPDKEG